MQVRNLTLNDDLDSVAELIYQTDPYIYPYWFDKCKNWKTHLIELIKSEGSAFYYKNILIAEQDNKPYGILVFLNENFKQTYDYCHLQNLNENFNYAIKQYVKPITDYLQSNTVYIPAVCVSKEKRRHHIGTKLLTTLKELHKNKLYKLHVLADNAAAIGLYEKLGFKKVVLTKGFNAPRKHKPNIYLMST